MAVPCPRCGTNFATEELLKEYEANGTACKNSGKGKTATMGGEHQCTECKKFFSHKSNLSRHTGTVHGDKARIRCDEPDCKATFARKDQMENHFKTVHLGIAAPVTVTVTM